jgi:hypothetical protein
MASSHSRPLPTEAERLAVSAQHPLRVDFLDPALHGLPGRLGMTQAPGTPYWDEQLHRHLGSDLARLRGELAVEVLANLIDDADEEECGLAGLADAYRSVGIDPLRWRIPDAGIPSLELAREIVTELRRRLALGQTVVVHCLAGMGRTGTIVSCALIASGIEPARALAAVRATRPGTVQNERQEGFVLSFTP